MKKKNRVEDCCLLGLTDFQPSLFKDLEEEADAKTTKSGSQNFGGEGASPKTPRRKANASPTRKN